MNTRAILAIGLLPWAALNGCQGLGGEQRSALIEGERAFHSRRYAAADERLSLFLDQCQERPELSRALYVRGMARAMLGQRAQAYADLRRAAQSPSRDQRFDWQPEAMLGILHFEDEQWDDSARRLKLATDRMPSVAPKDALLYRLGLCYERQGHWAAALTPYRQILELFPSGVYSEQATRRLQLRADHYSVQCGVFSSRENAEQVANQLRREGLSPLIRTEQRGQATYHIVGEGRYGAYQDACNALARIRGYVPQAVLWP